MMWFNLLSVAIQWLLLLNAIVSLYTLSTKKYDGRAESYTNVSFSLPPPLSSLPPPSLPSLPLPQIQRINQKLTQLNDVMTQVVTDVEQHKGTLAQMSTTVDDVSSSIPRYDTIMEELNLKIEILEVKACTGIYVWKVNDLARRTRDARMGRTLSLYSPPFYSSPHGYRVCLRAYLNGDGSGRGTHVSLYIVVMKSEYDDLLTWPFSHTVQLSLINQVDPLNTSRSISHKFSPNPASSSFQKPQETFNIASGFPEFAPVSVLNDPLYAKNDTMYFRVKLEAPSGPPTGPDQLEFR